MDAACNFPELLALDLDSAESLFASKRMTAGAPRPADAIFGSQSIEDLGLDLNQLDINLNDLSLEEASSILNSLGNLSNLNKLNSLNNAAALAYASSPRNFLPGKTSSTSRNQTSRQDHHSRSKSTTHAIPSDLSSYQRPYQRQQHHNDHFDNDDDNLHRLDQRPTTATGIDLGHSPGPIFSISRSKTKPSGPRTAASQSSSAVPRYTAGTDVSSTAAATHNHNHGHDTTGEWDTDSVDSFELPNIRLSRRSGGGAVSGGQGGVSKSGPVSSPAQFVHQHIQQQEEEQIQQLQQLQQLKQLRQLQQLKQQLQEKQQLQHLLEKHLTLQQEQEQKLKSGHKESQKEKEKESQKRKEQSRLRETKEKESARKGQSDDTPSHLLQHAATHLPAHTTAHTPSAHPSSLLPQQQQHRLSVDPPSDCSSRDSYGSLYDSYNYNYHRYSHDSNHSANTNTNTDDAASSIAGGGGGGGGGPRGRQQSVVTMATSVTSFGGGGPGCRFSTQSSRTTPSALGQYTNAKNGLTVSSQRESVATTASSGDRHVEFSLDTSRRGSTKARSDNTSDGSDDAAADVLAAAADNEKTVNQYKEVAVADKPQSSAKSPGRRVGNVSQSSWMRFDDDDEDEEDEDNDVDGDQTYGDIIKGMNGVNSIRSQSRDDTAVDRGRAVVSPVNHGSLPPRPKTAVGHVDSAVAPDFRMLNDYAAEQQKNKKRQSRVIAGEPAPATSINVPQRRSSLGHQDRKALLFREHDHTEQQHNAHHNHRHQHKLRHFLSFSDASVFSDAPRGGRADAFYDRPRTSSSSHYQMQPDIGISERRGRFDTDSIADREDPPVFLQKTVYRKPVPRPRTPLDMTPVKKATRTSTPSEHLTRRGREVFSVGRGGAKDDVNGDSNNNSDQPFVEPLLVSQFDDDSDSDHHAGATSDHGDDNDIDNHLVENDVDLFGDFEGAYNYDEGEDKIMLATMVPFSKQPPRSVRSIRSVSPGRPLDTLPDRHERPAIASVAALTENPEETSSHLQSWIDHASKSQLELVQQQQQQQQHSRASTSHVQEAFYEDDEQDEDEARDVVAADIKALTARPRTTHKDTTPAASSTAATPSSQYELQKALQEAQPVPLQFFSQPGTVGIPLPREVVDTLRVSVSCFPETMLSLSSFSIQTIRSYSRKVRRCSQTETDSTYRLLTSPTSPGLFPPSPTSMAHGVSPMSPTSPTSPTTSMSFDLGTGVTRSMTATSLTSNSSRRFWKLPKKIANNTRAAAPNLHLFTNFRSSSSSNNNSHNSNANNWYPKSPTMGMSLSMPRMSTGGRRGSSRTDNDFHSLSGNGEDGQQGKASGLSLKRIFPTGSDYLCDALYAHIIAFNYISLLCPPPPPQAAEGTSTEADETASSAQVTTEPVTAAHTMTTLASSAALFETTQQQRRQTIRIYVGSDVPLPAMSDIDPSSHDHMVQPLHVPLMELDEMHTNANTSRLLSMSSSRPPSRGYNNHDDKDDGRMISRKAALLLGIAETLEPDTASIGPSIGNGHHAKKPSTASGAASEFSSALPASLRSSSLARRYNSMRRRMAQSISESAETAAASAADPNDHTFAARAARAAAASKMIIKALPGSMGGNSKPLSVEISKPIYEAEDVSIPAEGVPATIAAATAAAAVTAASDASMRDLHAGLHACISQLVATMKLTTGQLGNTLLNTEAARAIDPLFLRTLCELVRSQEEQF